MTTRCLLALAASACTTSSVLGAVVLTPGGFTENFNSMGTAGTAAPSGFAIRTGPSGTSNATWSGVTGITPAGVAALIAAPGPLTASAAYPTTNNNNGFNAPAYNGPTPDVNDRALVLAPTTVSGAAIEFAMTNGTGAAQSGIVLSYDIDRYRVTTAANELPGYWLFYSLDAGATWTEAVNFRSTAVTVPNTLGSSSVSDTLTFSSAVPDGGSFLLRWVDDNAIETSPDQITGLDNVSITLVPAPGCLALTMCGGLLLSRRRR